MKHTMNISATNAFISFALIMAVFTGCKKEALNPSPMLDKQVFFTIRMDGIDYATFGYFDQSAAIPYGGPTLTKTVGLDMAGRTITQITLHADNTYIRPGNYPTESDSLQLGNCSLRMRMQKEGNDYLGIYTSFTGSLSDEKIMNNAYEEFYVGGVTSDLTIEREVNHSVNKAKMVEGHCSLRIFTSAGGFYKEYGASGNFRMYSR